ncbi:unnamed protein product [Leptidea sinapis]|uniref:Uncharacterized protein n=1 Tax=Leptidea sinapis TaxID=189913 RepID=A0A5E4Q9W8_9NEOP|nr:unnamed protein product [Leptidea sinapis]
MFHTSVKEQGPYNAEVDSSEPVPGDVVQKVGIFPETLAKLRVGQTAQLVEELVIEAGRRRGTRPSRAPRARPRYTLGRDAPAPRTSASSASLKPTLH